MENETKITIDKIVSFLKRYNPQRIYLFGSNARGDYTEFSDIDICMVIDSKPNEGISEFKVKILEDMLSLGITVSVDLLVITLEDFNREEKTNYSVYKEISKDGVTLYDRGSDKNLDHVTKGR